MMMIKCVLLLLRISVKDNVVPDDPDRYAKKILKKENSADAINLKEGWEACRINFLANFYILLKFYLSIFTCNAPPLNFPVIGKSVCIKCC